MYCFISFLAMLAFVECREMEKILRNTPIENILRNTPAITNSLVNLGKMEVSIYFGNPDHPNLPSLRANDRIFEVPIQVPRSLPSVVEEEPCPCTEFSSQTDKLISSPSEFITKLLTSNNLFKNPTSSLCCDSHEAVHENTFLFELTPNQVIYDQKMPMKSSHLTEKPPVRSKVLDILLFPKRKDLANFDFIKESIKPREPIKKVGKELGVENTLNGSTSVKKDLAVQANQGPIGTEATKVDEKVTANVL